MAVEIRDIRTSVENHHRLILDSHAKSATFLKDQKGRLIAYAGGFSVVFPYIRNNEKWGLRCWHADIGNVRKKFEITSKVMKNSGANYLCDFVYEEEGISINGHVYPTTRMRWIDGLSIKDYICKHKNSKNTMLKLADAFLLMAQDMHRNKFAHGDLQHGNIIVDENGNLFLIDYDSFYCPELEDKTDIIQGLKDYQHPLRKHNKITTEKIDYFSELIIYLSILAIAYNPSLIEKHQLEISERLLFKAEDFQDIKRSSIYNDILKLGGDFPILLSILELYLLQTSLSSLQPFDVVWEQLKKEPIVNEFSASCGDTILEGKEFTLSWNVENYTQILLDGEDVSSQNSKTLTTTSSSSHKLTVFNGFKQISKIVTVSACQPPTIAITSSKTKLHKGRKESVIIKWDVKNSSKTSLCINEKNIDFKRKSKGSYKCDVSETTVFTIKALALDRKTYFDESVTVEVHPDAEYSFTSDKKYVYPTIPFKLFWCSEHAIKVELNGEEVAKNGSKIIDGIEKETTYTLSVTDEFGITSKSVTINMLSIPKIEAMRVPMPEFTQKSVLNVNMNIPTMHFNVPYINTLTAKLKSEPYCDDLMKHSKSTFDIGEKIKDLIHKFTKHEKE